MTERDAFARVTTRPAAMLGLGGEVGTLAPGTCADLVALAWNPDAPLLRDTSGAERPGGAWEPVLTVRAGAVVRPPSGESPMTPSRWVRLKNNQPVLAAVFLLPTLLVLVSVVVYPFLSAVWISFQAKQAGLPGGSSGSRTTPSCSAIRSSCGSSGTRSSTRGSPSR